MSMLSDLRDREHWSYSSLNQFLNICSLQWAFDRVYRIERAFTSITLPFGSVFHRAMEWAALLRKEGKSPSAREGAQLFAELLPRQLEETPGTVRFEDGEDLESTRTQGQAMVAAAIAGQDPEEEVVSVSRAFAVPLVGASGVALTKPLVGEFDVIVRRDAREFVRDWKTSARRWPKAQARKSLQPTCYLYARQQLGEDVGDFEFDVTVKNKVPVCERHITTRTPDNFDRMVELARTAEALIAAGHFLPNEQSFYCSGCGFQAACKSWHRNRARLISVAA